MNYVKMLGISTGVAALLALVGAGTASATVLCATTTTPCAAPYGAGTVLDSALEPGTELIFEEEGNFGEVINTCTESTIRGKTTQQGSQTSTVKGATEMWTLNKCLRSAEVLSLGEFEIHHIAGTDNGDITLKNFEVRLLTLFGYCTFGSSSWFQAGTLAGGSKPVVAINAVLPYAGIGGLCPPAVRLKAEYTVAEIPIYVEPQ